VRTAIVGATGLLGKYLLREWDSDQLTGLSSKDLDIRDAVQVRHVIQGCRPASVVLAAAYTDVDGCETNPELAYETNCKGAINVAEAAKEVGSHLVFISTDYVFDGTKSSPYEVHDTRNPTSVYGRSKAEAEVQILHLLPEACIVRTSWLFGVGGKCFPDTILRLAADSHRELAVVNDQRGCPTYGRDLARAIRQLCRLNVKGAVHATNWDDCTWFEFATEILRLSGSPAVVRPVSSEQFPRRAKRPAYSVLSSASLVAYGITMPRWREALRDYMDERQSAA
jgi:dTDP-4-dehydrorhamnose reductase